MEAPMSRNIPTWERVLRAVAGIMILGLFGALTPPWRYLTLLGFVPLVTAMIGYCPLYHLIGWNRVR
jgi:Inner membrane protein YgaP-like, transmembrane domain